ncbi:hypothetical protein [Microbacterium allomyrinae]|uniref:DUF3168 domain-containing protein n=1 Tax=Microbacterium allomyrinae TaxID=2830666 RepID=A0A9X1S2A7_9MICO|nr:hypothetical protein [Microbacterium allomyrinae]MCC2031829.1 hypothetical protein [Microbacterium allomyrinae]
MGIVLASALVPTRFVDVEVLVLDFLTARIDAPVHTTVPAERPARFVRLWRNGGAAANRIVDRPQVTVEAWSTDSADAADLANRCRDLLLGAYTPMTLVRGVTEVSGPYSTPDPDTETPRYRFTVQLTVRAKR